MLREMAVVLRNGKFSIDRDTVQAMRHSMTHRSIFMPLEDLGRAQLIEQRLSEAIEVGLLDSGERLPSEAELAKLFGVAPVTAREALERLRTRGLVETRRGRDGGSFITGVEAPNLDGLRHRLSRMATIDILDFGRYYTILMAGAAKSSAKRASITEIDALEEILDTVVDADPRSLGRVEAEFHLELAAASQSARLVRNVIRLQAEFGTLLWLRFVDAAERTAWETTGRALVSSLRNREPATASNIVEGYLQRAFEWLSAAATDNNVVMSIHQPAPLSTISERS